MSLETLTRPGADAPALAGLSSAEAASRLAASGPNAVEEEKEHPLRRVVRHFWAPVPWMLEATIVLQLMIGEHIEAAMITTLLLLNVVLGVVQETRANATLSLLKQRLSPKARVRRDNVWIDIPSPGLVVGDVVQLSLGCIVPADLRLLNGQLLLDQSMLTGESIAIEAGAGAVGYAGALVRRGEAIAEITATGTRTYFGRTAELVRVAHVESSEQAAVMGIVRALTVVNFAIVVGMVGYAHMIGAHMIGRTVAQIIPLVLTAMLSAVPVALPATFTLASALGARTLALKGVLLKRREKARTSVHLAGQWRSVEDGQDRQGGAGGNPGRARLLGVERTSDALPRIQARCRSEPFKLFSRSRESSREIG